VSLNQPEPGCSQPTGQLHFNGGLAFWNYPNLNIVLRQATLQDSKMP